MDGKPTGRFTNGKTLEETIAAKLGVMHYLPAYLDPSLQNEDMIRGVSFASGASGFDPLTGRLLNVFSIPDQIEMFKEYIVKLKGIVGEKEANDIIEKSLYLVSWSSNDWGISYTALPIRAVQFDVPTYATFLVRQQSSNRLRVVDRGCCGIGTVELAVLCNKFSPLCPDDTKYLYWDSVHLTDKGYKSMRML